MKHILLTLMLIVPFVIQAQSVKFKVDEDKDLPLAGVTVSEDGTHNETITDGNGEALMTMNTSESAITFSFLGPQIKCVLTEGTDYVYLNLKKRQLIFYKDNKRIKKIKPKFHGY